MARIGGDSFLMGNELPDAISGDGEGPARSIVLDPFFIAKYPVTNGQFAEFVNQTRYVTEAERFGWSAVFHSRVDSHVDNASNFVRLQGMPWWLQGTGAKWSNPEGPGTSIGNRWNHPVVHVSFNDALAYCGWAGYRLPTEAEWECAARGGLEQKRYPWGDELLLGGLHMCNVWQGQFPNLNLEEDGFAGTAPVDSYLSNGYGLFTMAGNVWEWCMDFFSANWHLTSTAFNPVGPFAGEGRVIRGGSYLCHESYCFRYRNSARTSNTESSSTGHTGFRVVLDCA